MIILFLCLSLFSAEFELKDESGRAKIHLPDGWIYLQNKLGFQHLFLSPDEPPRDTLSVTMTGLKDIKLDKEKLKNDEKNYQAGRTEWAESSGAKITKFLGLETFKTENGNNVNVVGIEYSLNKFDYVEKSYFLECPTTLVHIKSIVLKLRKISLEKSVKEIFCF